MNNYLDPVYLAVTQNFWASRKYLEIFTSLVEILDYIEDVERNSHSLYKLIRFKYSQDLLSGIFNHNPFQNEPKVSEFYRNNFNKIISDLTRRFDWCPTNCKIDSTISSDIFCENNYIPDEIISVFNLLVNQCNSCSLRESFILLSPTHFKTEISLNSSVSVDFIFRQTASIYELFCIGNLLSQETINENIIKYAIDIFYQQSVVSSRISLEEKAQDYAFHTNFWKTIEIAKLAEADYKYKHRFIDSLTQVIYAKDIDIRLHKYGKISVDGKKYDKYSADVFQMGYGGNNKKCSRIYYCKISNKICFYEFNPDFHVGE